MTKEQADNCKRNDVVLRIKNAKFERWRIEKRFKNGLVRLRNINKKAVMVCHSIILKAEFFLDKKEAIDASRRENEMLMEQEQKDHKERMEEYEEDLKNLAELEKEIEEKRE